jgi:predicted nuclease with TOPRIM domain
MTNEEIQKVLEFMMQRQEVFVDHLERLEGNQEKLQEEVRGLTTEVRGLAGVVRQLGEAQIQTQNDMSHLTKIVTGIVEWRGIATAAGIDSI